MAGCEIDYCLEDGRRVLTVETEDQIITLPLCSDHAGRLQRVLAKQLGGLGYVPFVDLSSMKFVGSIGELQEALNTLDSAAASEQIVN